MDVDPKEELIRLRAQVAVRAPSGLRCVHVGETSHTGIPRSELRRFRTSRQSTPTANEIVEPTVADIEASVAGSNPLPTPSTVPASASRRRRRRLRPLPRSWDDDAEPDGPVQTHLPRRCVVPGAVGELPSTVLQVRELSSQQE